MKVCLAAPSSRKSLQKELKKSRFLLESFYSMNEWTAKLINYADMFMLDSGAFTFMNSKNKNVNFEEYLNKYIDFINKYNVKYFFELDIDSIVGYKEVLKLREKLELKTMKKCIPVWHKSRGKEEFLKLCEEYDYIAIGGIVTKEIKRKEYKFFSWMIKEAHKRNCKIHGLGFTNMAGLKKYHFDSVDSTAWVSGGRFGQLHIFENGEIKIIKQNEKNGNSKKMNKENLLQWIKFQEYADKHL